MFLSVFLDPTKLTTKVITRTVDPSLHKCHPFSLKTMGLLEYLNKNFRNSRSSFHSPRIRYTATFDLPPS